MAGPLSPPPSPLRSIFLLVNTIILSQPSSPSLQPPPKPHTRAHDCLLRPPPHPFGNFSFCSGTDRVPFAADPFSLKAVMKNFRAVFLYPLFSPSLFQDFPPEPSDHTPLFPVTSFSFFFRGRRGDYPTYCPSSCWSKRPLFLTERDPPFLLPCLSEDEVSPADCSPSTTLSFPPRRLPVHSYGSGYYREYCSLYFALNLPPPARLQESLLFPSPPQIAFFSSKKKNLSSRSGSLATRFSSCEWTLPPLSNEEAPPTSSCPQKIIGAPGSFLNSPSPPRPARAFLRRSFPLFSLQQVNLQSSPRFVPGRGLPLPSPYRSPVDSTTFPPRI